MEYQADQFLEHRRRHNIHFVWWKIRVDLSQSVFRIWFPIGSFWLEPLQNSLKTEAIVSLVSTNVTSSATQMFALHCWIINAYVELVPGIPTPNFQGKVFPDSLIFLDFSRND